jgi:hypothetical protein
MQNANFEETVEVENDQIRLFDCVSWALFKFQSSSWGSLNSSAAVGKQHSKHILIIFAPQLF